jgi:hypothetical protein
VEALHRTLALGFNTFREAVRARVLHGLLVAALAVTLYSVVVATLTLRDEARVIADLGAASLSLFSIVAAIVLGATGLHRELERRTIFPILTRRLRRHEYVIGKYLGSLATLTVFIALDGAVTATLVGWKSGADTGALLAPWLVPAGMAAMALWRRPHAATAVLFPLALVVLGGVFAALWRYAEVQLVAASCALAVGEVAIVGAIALLFSSFSSPFLTAVFSLGAWIVGRSSDTLAHLPERTFGKTLAVVGRTVASIVPNLQLFVPERPILLGRVADLPTWTYVGRTLAIGGAYAAVLGVVSCLLFARRDFV